MSEEKVKELELKAAQNSFSKSFVVLQLVGLIVTILVSIFS